MLLVTAVPMSFRSSQTKGAALTAAPCLMLRLSFGRGSGAGVSPSLTSEIQPRWAQGETQTSGACCFVCFADSTPFLLLSPTSGSPIHTPSSKASESGSPHHHHHSARGCWLRPRCLVPRTLQLVGLTTRSFGPGQPTQRGLKGQERNLSTLPQDRCFPNLEPFWSLL